MRRFVRLAIVLGIVTSAAAFPYGTRATPADRLSTRVAIAGIRVYQATLAPVMAATGVRCRFVPSCSHYAETAIGRNGVIRGGWQAAKRIARCGPWTPMGTVDSP